MGRGQRLSVARRQVPVGDDMPGSAALNYSCQR